MSTSKQARTLSCSNQALSFETCVFCQLAVICNVFFVYNSFNLFKSKHGSLIQDNSLSTVYFTDTRHRSVICTPGLIATNNSCLWSPLKGRAFWGVFCDSFSNLRKKMLIYTGWATWVQQIELFVFFFSFFNRVSVQINFGFLMSFTQKIS